MQGTQKLFGGFVYGLMMVATLVATSARAQSVAAPQPNEACFSPDENCDAKLVAFINSARTSIDMAIYNVTLNGVSQALQDAQGRGVHVRLVIDKEMASSRTSLIQKMASAGLTMKFGNTNGIMHNKFTIVDGRMLELGSYNYTVAATKYNLENQLYLNTPSVLSRYQGYFEKMYAAGFDVPADFQPTPPPQNNCTAP